LSEDQSSGTVLAVNDDTKIVTKGTGKNASEVGCLETKFDIKLTVEQVD
jgi:hypothetical protein